MEAPTGGFSFDLVVKIYEKMGGTWRSIDWRTWGQTLRPKLKPDAVRSLPGIWHFKQQAVVYAAREVHSLSCGMRNTKA
jgi:hypothetical protein